ncbi:MAG: glycoside hydrolase family 97 catalytic domain-containing protein [Bacteroidaceae bacterium]|nr:glycoside hydrolase family 97 catalytic domain-containing protein [Bacteroidaceae bacterium]
MTRFLTCVFSFVLAIGASAADIPGKQIYIPSELRSNDFESDSAQWSYSRMRLTPNFAIFWQRGFGADLSNPPQLDGHPTRVDIDNLAARLEEFYAFYRDSLRFIHEGSVADRYRMMVMLNYSLEGTAYGGDYDEVIGAFWVAPNRIQDRRLNCVAHELGHSFQMQVHCDRRARAGILPDTERQASDATSQFIDTQDSQQEDVPRWFGGGFFEMTSQWMLWHVNPDWIRDELFHWQAYQRQPHKALFSWENVYHTPYVLEWWSQQRGLDIMAKIYQTAENPEDPADAYMRLTGLTTEQFNDELFEAHRHTVFLDFRHAYGNTRQYAGHWPQLNEAGAPEAGGFDARLMPTPKRGESVSVDFAARQALSTDGWRYGFVAQLSDGRCLYSQASKALKSRTTFTAPRDADVRELYFVVMGAPTQRHDPAVQSRRGRRGGQGARESQEPAPERTVSERFPYEIVVTSSGALTSPNGRLTAVPKVVDGALALDITLDGQKLIERVGGCLLTDVSQSKPSLRLLKRETLREHIDAFAYRQSAFDVVCNLATYRFNNLFDLEVRIYDEGLAYRFVQTAKRPLQINDERFQLSPAADALTYLAYTTNEKKPEAMAFQNIYTSAPLSQLSDQWAFLPVTLDFKSAKVTIIEADLEAYPGMFVRPAEGKLSGAFARYPRTMEYYNHRGMSHVAQTEEFIAKTSGRRTFPWRIFTVTTDDRQMPVNNLVYALASPNRIGATSWIRGGKSAWDWWNAWTLRGVPFKAGINQETYKYYIDYAQRFGLEYVILDEGWYEPAKADIMNSIPEIDIKALVDYARGKGVKIILWTVFNVLDEHLEEACKKYSDLGVAGFKVDFLDRDDQTAVEMAYRIAEAAARHHLVLDYHGFYKPTGLNRTYPNIINFESVFGMEEVKWNSDKKDMPQYDVTFPFIRGMAGSVDYTPGAMRNAQLKDFKDIYYHPMSMGTRCHQLAAYVVHDSPLTMLADAATSYEAEPDYTRFLASIPNDVDETRVLLGRLGEYIVVARRKGEVWWIGGQTNWQARGLKLPDLYEALGLDRGRENKAVLYADGPNAENFAEDYTVSEFRLDGRKPVEVVMAPGGGFVLRIN